MDTKAIVMKRNRATKRNPIAKDLSDGRYHQRVVKDKTKYTRKEKYGQTNRHYEHSDNSKTST
jgi:hypothetical protein